MSGENEKKVKKIGLRSILGWIVGFLLVASGILEMITMSLGLGFFTFLAGLVIFPPFWKIIREKFHFELSGVLKLILFFVLLGLAGFSKQKTDDKTQPSIKKTEKKIEESSEIEEELKKKLKEVEGETKNKTKEKEDEPKEIVKTESRSYKEIFSFSGNGAKKSDTFTITGDKFKIKYDCQGDLCQAFLQSPSNSLKMELIMNSMEPIKDESIFYGSGEYYINSNSMGNYSMIVQDYK